MNITCNVIHVKIFQLNDKLYQIIYLKNLDKKMVQKIKS